MSAMQPIETKQSKQVHLPAGLTVMSALQPIETRMTHYDFSTFVNRDVGNAAN